MGKPMDPKTFGLPPRTVLERVGDNKIAIVIRRKSRIIMKDGRNILEKASKINRTSYNPTICKCISL